ncbi:MAG: hypothetical protein AAFR03_00530 [Pseudomonadota bacterium]
MTIIDQPDDVLYEMLGRYFLSEAMGSQPASPSEENEAGRNGFKSRLEKVKKEICQNSFTRALLVRPELDAGISVGLMMSVLINVGIFSKDIEEVSDELAAFATLVIRQVTCGMCRDYLK